MTLADTLHGLRIQFESDNYGIRVKTFAPFPRDGDGVWFIQITHTVGAAPISEEELSALMRVVATEIWQHHARRVQESALTITTKVE